MGSESLDFDKMGNRTTVWDTGSNCGSGKGRICRIDDPHQSLELGYSPYGELTLQRPTIDGQTGCLCCEMGPEVFC